MAAAFNRTTGLVHFVIEPKNSSILIGEPVDAKIDFGTALRDGKDFQVSVFSGKPAFSPGSKTDQIEIITKLLSPISVEETSTIRCVGLDHPKEVKMTVPDLPTLFISEDSIDYKSELVTVVGRVAENVFEADAMDYVLGFTAANDISARKSQLAQSQWCFQKGFHGACSTGLVLASTKLIPDASKVQVRGLKNGKVLQNCGTKYV
ncbi:fumarylacetoacetate hydrolase family protein [Calycina marina]|uniref:Fumarylacetoacetate hydrolase family protein n=1 Tax=Calycina marina TaxID=1763456 RepID=A0A9P7Z695_9HELO|nr:fumarylacetoacetate hydrolase family protein [Calycina marina]